MTEKIVQMVDGLAKVAAAKRRKAVQSWLAKQGNGIVAVSYWGKCLPCSVWELIDAYADGNQDDDLEISLEVAPNPDAPFWWLFLDGVMDACSETDRDWLKGRKTKEQCRGDHHD